MDAQNYRMDFAKVVIEEMVRMHGGEAENDSEDNETKMKRLFDGY